MYGINSKSNDALVHRVNTEGIGKLCVRRNGNAVKPRVFTAVTGLHSDHNLGVFNSSVDTVLRALTERYFFIADGKGGFDRPIQPRKRAFANQHFVDFRRMVLDATPNLPRLSRQQVVDRYTGSKKRVYHEAMLSLDKDPLTDQDARLGMFSKYGKDKLTGAPRGINPRSPRYNLELGRYLKHAEKHLLKAINVAYGKRTSHTVIKGLNANDSASVLRAKWDVFSNPVAVGLDASKFDAHVSVLALEYEHSFYNGLFPGSRKLKWMLKQQLRNSGTAYVQDGKVDFSIKGTRSSGDLNTGLGNCILMCAMIYAYAKRAGVDIELANNGDDCVVFMEQECLDDFIKHVKSWFSIRGFNMVSETPVYEFEQLEFCQTRPVLINNVWRMIRNHDTVLVKDTLCLIPIPNDKVFRKWLGAVGECGTILNSGVPVLQSFYSAIMRNGVSSSMAFKQHIFKNSSMMTRIMQMDATEQPVTDSARVSYYYAFGITPDEQLSLERYFDSMVIDSVDLKPIDREYL